MGTGTLLRKQKQEPKMKVSKEHTAHAVPVYFSESGVNLEKELGWACVGVDSRYAYLGSL